MKSLIKKMILMVVIFPSFLSIVCEAKGNYNPSLIITKGTGGDASGATIIRTNLQHGTPDLVNLSATPIDKINAKKYSCVLIIGQGAIKDMLDANNVATTLTGKTIGIYTHLIDNSTLNLIRKLKSRATINVFFTNSQINILKIKNISGYKLLNSKNVNIRGHASQVISTVNSGKISKITPASALLENANYVIWLGGNYTTSSGTQRTFTTNQIVSALKPLSRIITSNSSVAIMLSPRFLETSSNKESRDTRLTAIQTLFPQSKVTFYANKLFISQPVELDSSVHLSPPYQELMTIPWSKGTLHFVSGDQYNLFTDLHTNIKPFLLDPNDIDQIIYAIDYMNNRKKSLTQDIVNYGCS